MTRAKFIALITAVVLVVAGVAIIVGVSISVGMDYSKLSTQSYETKSFGITESFENIDADVKTADLRIKPSTDGRCTVSCRQPGDWYSVYVEDGTLFIRERGIPTTFGSISFTLESPSVTVSLPEKEYKSLTVTNSAGSTVIADGPVYESISVESNAGEINCGATATGDIALNSLSGDVQVKDSSAQEISIKTGSGEVKLGSVSVAGDFTSDTDSGDVTLTDVTCANLNSETCSGEISMKNVIAEDKMTVKSNSGDITVSSSDAGEIQFTSQSGDVSGTLLTEKIFSAQSTSGEVSVPRTFEGGVCSITTNSGDIGIKIE